MQLPKNRSAIMVCSIILGVTTLVALFGIPVVVMPLYSRFSDHFVDRMSSIGQSFGGLSAMLSAGTMAGVIVALIMQIRQLKISQAQGMRALQVELMSMLLRDPDLRPISTSYQAADPSKRQRDIYSNLTFKYLELGYETGYFPRNAIVLELQGQFRVDDIRCYWREVRERYEGSVCNNAQREFVTLVNMAYEQALYMQTAEPDRKVVPGEPPTSPGAGGVPRFGSSAIERFTVGAAFGAAVAALIVRVGGCHRSSDACR